MRYVCAFLLVVVCGCGKSAEEKAHEKAVEIASGGKVNVHGDKVTIKTDEGTYSSGENEVPKGFPLKVYAGTKVATGAHSKPAKGGEAFHIQGTVAAPIEKVADFYESQLKDKGLKVEKTEFKTGEMQQVVLSGKADKTEAVVTIMKEADEKDTTTMLTWSVEP
jgi:hypothetical protein